MALPTEDLVEVVRRFTAIQDELGATGTIGALLAHRVDVMSVRLDRSVRHETTTLAEQIRQAQAEFDTARAAEADARHEILDLTTISSERTQAADRALFNPSLAATLARRYEAAAERGFFRALHEFRATEAKPEVIAPTQPTSFPRPIEPVDRPPVDSMPVFLLSSTPTTLDHAAIPETVSPQAPAPSLIKAKRVRLVRLLLSRPSLSV